MGRFCLTAQVEILLGRVFRHVNDTTSTDEFRHQEATVLDNTIAALTQVSLEEGLRQQYVLDMVPFTPEWTTTDILVPVPVFYYTTMNDGKSLARGKG
ncbi:unnamed protein product [Clonostachys chloroleuca]|uniref:Uncharacterized protein n=1 Tax=Clonostachys chloroleuca TaxID=1926264 RepID=A0AA35PXR3_9HYPO|nr:unnamed protein product [Clonostachys chloroleuca]